MDKRQPLKAITDPDEVRLLHLFARMNWDARPDHSYLDLVAHQQDPESSALREVERCFNMIMRGEVEGFKAREYLGHMAHELIDEISNNPQAGTADWQNALIRIDPWEPWRAELFRTGFRVWLADMGSKDLAGLQELAGNYYDITD